MSQTLTLNGKEHSLEADPSRSLLSVLRDDLQLTGAKYGCGEGECGACTVLIDGKAARSCITELGDCLGKSITTIEGLARDGELHPLQRAFIECDAMQCGYCTPGMIMSSAALLSRKPQPARSDVAHALQGNICRCGTYARILAAVLQAAEGKEAGR